MFNSKYDTSMHMKMIKVGLCQHLHSNSYFIQYNRGSWVIFGLTVPCGYRRFFGNSDNAIVSISNQCKTQDKVIICKQ